MNQLLQTLRDVNEFEFRANSGLTKEDPVLALAIFKMALYSPSR